MTIAASTSGPAGTDDAYPAFLAHVSATFLDRCDDGPIFTTDAEGLWELYLDGFDDPAERQHHNCHACRDFIRRYGGLVRIDATGRTTPVVWCASGTPAPYLPAVAAMNTAVRRAKVTGVFLSSARTWGTPRTGAWHHLAVRPPAKLRYSGVVQTAEQAMAEKREDYRTVMRALGEYSREHLETAVTLLKSDALYRSAKVLGQAEWLRDLRIARTDARGAKTSNAVWHAVATAPAGFCHPRASMIGTLLDDIAAGKTYDEVSAAFAAKMHPLSYQRPKAAPKAGTIDTAERVFERLGLAASLRRRFARVDEVEALWRPRPPRAERATDGVFGHLRPRAAAPAPAMDIPTQAMTWAKFATTVMPGADRIEILVPRRGSYAALVTAADSAAPPILQWDRPDWRNPVSWYVWNGGSLATQWGLRAGQFRDVTAITLKPSQWHGGFEHQGKGVLFLIDGARESRSGGAGLFPEFLRAELHGVRSVIERYSRTGTIEGLGEPHAAGIMCTPDSWREVTLRVWSAGRSLDYRLDRWD